GGLVTHWKSGEATRKAHKETSLFVCELAEAVPEVFLQAFVFLRATQFHSSVSLEFRNVYVWFTTTFLFNLLPSEEAQDFERHNRCQTSSHPIHLFRRFTQTLLFCEANVLP